MSNEPKQSPKPRYLWPWFLLAGVVLGIVLAVLWLTAEVRRLKERRQYDFVPHETRISGSVPGFSSCIVWRAIDPQ
jgi:hypothetical protein